MKLGCDVIQIGSTFDDPDQSFKYFNSPKDTLDGNGYKLDSQLISRAAQAAQHLVKAFQ
jgi:hypothetical protein